VTAPLEIRTLCLLTGELRVAAQMQAGDEDTLDNGTYCADTNCRLPACTAAHQRTLFLMYSPYCRPPSEETASAQARDHVCSEPSAAAPGVHRPQLGQ